MRTEYCPYEYAPDVGWSSKELKTHGQQVASATSQPALHPSSEANTTGKASAKRHRRWVESLPGSCATSTTAPRIFFACTTRLNCFPSTSERCMKSMQKKSSATA